MVYPSCIRIRAILDTRYATLPYPRIVAEDELQTYKCKTLPSLAIPCDYKRGGRAPSRGQV